MLTRTHLIVDVRELLGEPGSKETLSFSEAVPGLALELVRVDEAIAFDLSVTAMEDGVLVEGTLEGRYVTVCRKCLREDTHPFGFRAAELYQHPPGVPEQRYVVLEETIDLDPLVRDNVLLELPLNPKCSDDCAGLCPECGANLNEGSCGCPERVEDLRWAPLQDLLREG